MLSTIFEHSFHSGTGMDLPVLSEISKRAVANSVMIFRRVASFLALVSSSFRSSMYAFLSIPRRPRFSSMSRSFLSTASAFISPFSSFFTSFFFSTFFRSPLSLFFFVAPSAGPVFLSQKSLVIPPAPTSISTSDESLSLPLPSASSSSLQSEKSSPAGSPVFFVSHISGIIVGGVIGDSGCRGFRFLLHVLGLGVGVVTIFLHHWSQAIELEFTFLLEAIDVFLIESAFLCHSLHQLIEGLGVGLAHLQFVRLR
mmetsp:Transcript_7247/g.13505  ORF Transcript_7247/g.13505 Transcript_7247/m.13505 type:complete len:255 (+) Transcript_7247:1767-2531(+)